MKAPTPMAAGQEAGGTAWRRALRQSLIHQRTSLDKETLARWQITLDRHLATWFHRAHPGKGAVIAMYWPHRGEYDIRPLAAGWREHGAVLALPVIERKAAPMQFRRWDADTPMEEGAYGIAHPAHGETLHPAVVIAPAVGFDNAGYRLGYGGGYFDRTLAELAAHGRRPATLAIAHEFARIETLHPQAHDIPMDWVVTAAGLHHRLHGRLVPSAAL